MATRANGELVKRFSRTVTRSLSRCALVYSTTSKVTSSSSPLRPYLGTRNPGRGDWKFTRSIFLIPATLELPTVVPTRVYSPLDTTRQRTVLPSCGYQTQSCHRLTRVQTRTLSHSTRTGEVDRGHSHRSRRSEPRNATAGAAHSAMHLSGRRVGPTVGRSVEEVQQRRSTPDSTGRRAGFSIEANGVLDEESTRLWTVPNVITMGRICFCPVLVGFIVTSNHKLALAGIFAASVTDWLDGYIARKWNQKSVLGGFLDPLADKIMVTSVALALGQQGIMPAPLVVLMVGRDALLTAGSLFHRYRTKKPEEGFFDVQSLDYRVTPSVLSKIEELNHDGSGSPGLVNHGCRCDRHSVTLERGFRLGRVNTALQFSTLWLGLSNTVYHIPGDPVFGALCVVTGAATVASGANYLLVSGLRPKGHLGRHLMVHRARLQKRCRHRGLLIREGILLRRDRIRARGRRLREKMRVGSRAIAVSPWDRMNTAGGHRSRESEPIVRHRGRLSTRRERQT